MSKLPFVLWVDRVVRSCYRLHRIPVTAMPHIDYWRLYSTDTPVERAAYLVSLVVD